MSAINGITPRIPPPSIDRIAFRPSGLNITISPIDNNKYCNLEVMKKAHIFMRLFG
jgi:hypothetical protein